MIIDTVYVKSEILGNQSYAHIFWNINKADSAIMTLKGTHIRLAQNGNMMLLDTKDVCIYLWYGKENRLWKVG